MIGYPPIFYGAELKLAFKGRLTWKVADTLQYKNVLNMAFTGRRRIWPYMENLLHIDHMWPPVACVRVLHVCPVEELRCLCVHVCWGNM